MRKELYWKAVLWSVIYGCAASLPLAARPGRQVVGQVVASSGALLEGIAIPNQGTILEGDTLTTNRGGSAIVKFSPTAQANVSESSSLRIRIVSGHTVVQLASGLVSLEGVAEDALIVQTPSYEISSATAGKSVFIVAVLADQRTLVSPRKGNVSVTEIKSGQSYTLPEGEETIISETLTNVAGQEKEGPRQAPGIPAGPATGGPKQTSTAPPAPRKPRRGEGHKTSGTMILLLGGGAAAGIGAALAAASGGGGSPPSPSRP